MKKIKLVIAVSGASGTIYAKRMIEKLQTKTISDQIDETGIVFSKNAEDIWKEEIGEFSKVDIKLPVYSKNSFDAPFASGSAGYDAMIIAPCPMGVLGRIAAGVSDDLITRTADVILKEKKKLILLTREMPLSLIHLQNMTLLTQAGAQIFPASPYFYHQPKNIDELVDTVVNRVLESAGISTGLKPWQGSGIDY